MSYNNNTIAKTKGTSKMTCENCVTNIPEGQKFCTGCGAQVGEEREKSIFTRDLASGVRNKTWSKMAKVVVGIVIVAVAAYCVYCKKSKEDVNELAKQILESGLPESFRDNDLGDVLEVISVTDVTLLKKSGNEYAGLANVKLRAKKPPFSQRTFRYDLKGIYDGTELLLEFKPQESQADKLIEFVTTASE